MGGKQTKILTGNCPTDRINVSFTETFRVHPTIAVTPISKYGEYFNVKITEVDRYGFRFECIKLNGEPLKEHKDFFQWTACSIFE